MPTSQTTAASGAKTKRAASTAAKSSARKTAAKRAASTRSNASSSRSTAAVKDSSLGAYAERAVLIPVGAALIARERVLAGVNDTFDTYSTAAKANAQLRRFERRGNTARNRVERELRKTRVRVEREVRQTRSRVEREVKQRRRDGEDLAGRVQERLLNLV
ncbi:MAG TPA: hypothetical protein VFW38_10850 [Solirubrobacteraceae bacterium]|nr:hypothetical protein [Solirubrobacteraceae bacterium]